METQITKYPSSGSAPEDSGQGLASRGSSHVGGVPVHSSPTQAGSETIDTKALLNSIRRRWFLAVLLGAICGGGAGIAAWQYIPAPYLAFAELRISSVDEKILFNTAEAKANFNTYKQTQSRLIKDHNVLSVALLNPELSNLQTITEQAYPVSWLEKKVVVSSPGTEFIRISLEGDSPSELAKIVNAISATFLDEVVLKEKTKRVTRLVTLQDFSGKIDQELETKRKSLQTLAEELKTTDPETLSVKRQMEYEYHSQLRSEFTRLRFELMQASIQLAARKSGGVEFDGTNEQLLLENLLDQMPESLLNERIKMNPEYQRIASNIRELEWTAGDRLEKLGPKHPELLGFQRRLKRQKALAEELEKQIRQRILTEVNSNADTTLAGLQDRVNLLEAEKSQLEVELNELKGDEQRTGSQAFQLEEIKREIELTEKTSNRFRSEIEALAIEVQAPQRIKLQRKAAVPHAPQMSKKYKMAGLAGIGVFGLIAGGIVLLDYRRRRVSTIDEISNDLRIRIIGALPILPRAVLKAVENSKRRLTSQQVALRSVLKEAIDSARTVLIRDAKVDTLNVIMVTSASDGEGKTSVACHLATSFARAGRKVVLVDCDLRRPTVHRVYNLESSHGFCEILRGDKPIEGAAQETPTPGLSVIPAGRIDSKALQTLSEGGAQQVFKHLIENYEFVIVDSAPLLPVSDSLLLAQDVDGVILTIRRDISRLGNVAAAQQRLEMIGVPPIGAVLIGLDEIADRYGYYSRHYNTLDVK